MFLDEARIAARISHPNVAQVFELGKQENTYWIAMEYLHGEPLREMMRYAEEVGAPMAPELAARVIADAAEGLHAAHELRGKDGESLNLVHRDVTPHNLFVTYEGQVKVVDFGIAKVSGRLSSTRAGTLKGKLAYMSPEQVRGAEIDRRTDIFALGVVLWELTVGQRLFRMESDLETLEKVQACIVPPPSSIRPDFPAELESIVMKALQKRVDTRYQTARELSRALQQYLMHSGNFIGHEEVAAYVTQIFGDRIRKREAHLRWAAEVTQTISLEAIRQGEGSNGLDEISVVSYDEDPSIGAETNPATPAAASQGARSLAQTAPNPAVKMPQSGARGAQAARPQPAASKPQLPPAHGIHLPAPRVPQSVAAQPAKSVMISATPPSAPNYPAPAPIEEDEDEEIATVVVPSRLALEQQGQSRGPYPAAGAPAAPIPAAGMPAPAGQPHQARSVKQTMMGGFAGAPAQAPQAPAPQPYQPPQQQQYQQQPMPGMPGQQMHGQQQPQSIQQTMPPNRQPAPAPPYYPDPSMGAPGAQPYQPAPGGFVPPGVNAGQMPQQGAYPAMPGYPMPGADQQRRIADETVQLSAVRSNRMVYIAAGAATFFVVIGVFAVLLLRGMLPGAAPAPSASVTAAATTSVPAVPSSAPTAVATGADTAKSASPVASTAPTAPSATASATAKKNATPTPTGGTGPAPTGGKTEPTPPAGGDPGYLTVVCTPFCDAVIASGRNLGPSPVVHVPLPPGQYRVTLRREGGTTKVIPAIIVSGQVTSHRVSMN